MCSPSCILFGAKNLVRAEVEGKRVLEVGAYDANGSLRPLLESWKPAEYIGVDIAPGPCVDVVCDAENLAERFGEGSFDLVVATELVEHVRDWRKVFSNLKRVCRAGGSLLVTTRSRGYGYHGYPDDFWRYELEDFKAIFSDFEILALESDFRVPGAFVKARKPAGFKEADLSGLSLYSMCVDRRIPSVSDEDMRSRHYRRLKLKDRLRSSVLNAIHKVGGFIFSKL